jgi:type IV secretory pathway TraG/TraD family ATPase VirD4
MYQLARLFLALGALCCFYSLALVMVIGWPWAPFAFAFLLFVKKVRGRYNRLSTLGSARWADEKDLQRAGMLNAESGLILGRMP